MEKLTWVQKGSLIPTLYSVFWHVLKLFSFLMLQCSVWAGEKKRSLGNVLGWTNQQAMNRWHQKLKYWWVSWIELFALKCCHLLLTQSTYHPTSMETIFVSSSKGFTNPNFTFFILTCSESLSILNVAVFCLGWCEEEELWKCPRLDKPTGNEQKPSKTEILVS